MRRQSESTKDVIWIKHSALATVGRRVFLAISSHYSTKGRSKIFVGSCRNSQPFLKYAFGSLRMISDLVSTLRWAHEANIQRYQRLLETSLTDNERRFVERRIAEEQEALRQVAGNMNPLLPQLDLRVDGRSKPG
jgi:hypothetical protein